MLGLGARLGRLRMAGERRAVRLIGALWQRAPIGEATRQRLVQLVPGLSTVEVAHQAPPPSFARPAPRLRVPVARADERAVGHRAAEPGVVTDSDVRLLARYVANDPAPWAEVCRALPQLDGHVQPRLPGSLGYYRGAESLRAQAELARTHGIDAFVFALEGTSTAHLETYLADGALPIGACVELRGPIGADDPRIPFVARAAADPRALQVAGRPLVFVADLDEAADARAIAEALRRALGEVCLVEVQPEPRPPVERGFDLALTRPLAVPAAASIGARQTSLNPAWRGQAYDYRAEAARVEAPLSHRIPAVSVGCDDEPMHPGAGTSFLHASPRAYRDWLDRAIAAARRAEDPSARLVVVDAWNDWRRGAVLEPDTRLGHAFLLATREARGRRVSTDRRPCVVVHVYYVDLLDEIAVAIKDAGLSFRVIVTTVPDRETLVRERLSELGLVAEVEVHENRGRDILPFLRVANRLLDEGVEVVCKLHTKHSAHRTDGARWRAELIGSLLHPARAAQIHAAFARDAALGCVAPEGHLLPFPVYWGWNEDNVRYLCRRMGVPDPDLENDRFCAGSMFWIRLAALRPLLDAHLGEWEFEAEGGYIDGTLPHAIERALALAVKATGQRTAPAAEVCGLPFADDGQYRYAEASQPA